MSTKILIVEDDRGVAEFLEQACQEEGYSTTVSGNGLEAARRATAENFDIILLDLMLPGLDGLSVCREIRASRQDCPILVITASDTLQSKVDGLDAGADDYVCKPFRLPEILARIRALLRRQTQSRIILRVSDLTLDTKARLAVRGTRPARLSATECALLEFMMRHQSEVLPRLTILQNVWQYDFGGKDNVLDVYIGYLRLKIDKGHSPLIHTVRGVGYRFDVN